VKAADLAHVALALAPGVGRSRFDALVERFETPEEVLRASTKDLVSIHGIGLAAATAIREVDIAKAERVVERAEGLGGRVVLPSDPLFPESLKTIPEAPTVFFAVGHLEYMAGPAIAVVGSRSHSRYGAEVCRYLTGGAARSGIMVASGMARGLDAVAHTAALDANGRTVGVLGNGLGVVYPSANSRLYERMQADGCLITEFPPGERPNAGSFPRRNRLISGLAQCTLVIEAGERSGTLITVDQALRQGRDVLAVPGPVTSPTSLGCNRLLQQGAKPVIGVQDILEEFNLTEADLEQHARGDLTEEERRLLDALGMGVETVDDAAERLRAPASDILAVLTGLEIRGLVQLDPGGLIREPLRR